MLHRSDIFGRGIGWIAMSGVLAMILAFAPTAAANDDPNEELSSEELLKLIEDLTEGDEPPTEAELTKVDELLEQYAVALEREKQEEKKGKASRRPRSKPKATPTPTPKPTPKSKPAARRGTSKKTSRSTREPPSSSRRRSSRNEGPPDDEPESKKKTSSRGKARDAAEAKPASKGVALQSDKKLEEEAERLLLPYDKRPYEFGIKGGSYKQLIEQFGRMASLDVIGEAPSGTVDFVSSEMMDFKTALGRVQTLLFNHDDQYWILFKQARKMLEIVRVTEISRVLPENRIYPTLAEYKAANLDENELALLLYTPESGSIAELEPLRDYMPDYVRIAQYADENAMTVFGLVRDINKYLRLIDKFRVAIDDPAKIKIIKVKHILPTEAKSLLSELMIGIDAKPGVPASKRRSGQRSVADAQARGVTIIPNDDHGTLLVQAMPSKIEDVEKFLEYIDLPMAGEDHAPVVVKVKHARAGEVISLVRSIMGAGGNSGPSASPTQAKRASRSSKGRARAARSTGMSVVSDDLTMVEWPPANSIILIGKDDKVTEAKSLIDRFDVPDELETKIVAIEHRNAGDLVTLAAELLQKADPAAATEVALHPDATGKSIVLAGPRELVVRAEDIIAKLDIEDDSPDEVVHSVKLQNVNPTTLLTILNTWDAQANAPSPPSGKSGKKSGRRSRGAGSRFQGDEINGMIYVVCTDEDWESKYRPLIVRLDGELSGEAEHSVLPVDYIDPAAAVDVLKTVYAKPKNQRGATQPTFLAVSKGVMVIGAIPAQIETMKQILARADVDPVESGAEQRRVFVLEHVTPDEVIPVIEAVVGTGPAPARKKKGAPGKAPTLRFASNDSKLWVSAPSRDMEQIAALIEELDVPDVEKETRHYEFAIGTNVNELAQTLSRFFPAAGTVTGPGRTPAKGSKRTGAKRRSPGGKSDGDILFVAQPATRKIFVSAPLDRFEEIEETIELLRPDVLDRPGMAVKFYPVEKGDPAAIASMIEPIMSIKMDELIASGEVPEPQGKKSTLSITPDLAAGRIIVAAPNVLLPEVESLIEQLQSGDYGETVVRKVTLVNATATDMAATINSMLSGKSPAPARRASKAGAKRGRKTSPAVMSTRTPTGVTVVPVPGGDALVLTGLAKDVDEIERWIRMLDEDATADKVMKVYRLELANVETLADEIMTILDSAPAGKAKRKGGALDDEWEIDLGGPRRGTEISLTTDYYNNTMIVWASPRKIAEINELVALYEEGVVKPESNLPSMLFDLKYAEAYDAMYDLEEFIDAKWETDKPKVDYIPFQNTLVVKSKNTTDFKEIEEIITKYIDKEGKGGGTTIAMQSVKGREVDDVVKLLLMRLEGMDVEIEGLQLEDGQELVEELTPEIERCVLPSPLARALEALGAAALTQEAPNEEEDDQIEEPPAEESEIDSLIDQAILLKQMDEAAQEVQEEKTEDQPKKKLKIRVDPRTNSISFEGPSHLVADAEYTFKKIMEDLEALPQLPDIRVLKLKYLDPNVATQVLESMYNAGGQTTVRGRGSAQQRALQQQRQMQQQMRQMQQLLKQQGQGGEDDKSGKRGKDDKDQKETPAATPAATSTSIQVFPYPSLNAIIVKAPTEMYPAIKKLVATIDRRTDPTTDYRFFKIENQLASDVEMQLKTIFGIDQQERARQRQQQQRRQPRGRQGGDQGAQAVAEMMRQQLNLAMMGDEGGMSSTESITITSNNVTNTVMVLAPRRVLELAEKIIADIETQMPPSKVTVTYELKYADATVVVPHLEALFAAGARGGRPAGGQRGQRTPSNYHPDDVQAVFIADTLNNAVVVRALEDDLEQIESVIRKIDVQSGPEEEVVSVEIVNCDAVAMAKTLEQIYGMQGGRRRGPQSAKKIQFVGEERSNTIFVRAPEERRKEILTRIEDMDIKCSESVEPKFVSLQNAPAETVAKVIEQALDVGKRRGKSRIKITGDDTTKRLMIICPDEMFPKIEKLAQELDVRPGLMDIQVFPLKHARAPEVLKQMEDMVNKLLRQVKGKNVQLDPFSASADERSNRLVVMGGPITFMLVQRVLDQIDVPTAAPIAVETMVIALSKARAAEVAKTINSLFKGRKDGIDPPRAEPNVSTNTLLVRGTQGQLDEIREKIIKPLDEFAEPPETMLTEAVIPLEYIQADEAAVYLTKWFNDRKKAFDALKLQGIKPSELTVSITPEASSNQLVVMANEANLERIRTRVADIDKEGAGTLRARVTRIYPLRFVDPNNTRQVITTAFKAGRGAAEKDRVEAAVELQTQSVVVTASEANQEAVAAPLADLDKESGLGQRVREIYEMKNARASRVAEVVNDTLGRTRQKRRGGQMPVTVVPDDELNVLIVSGTQKEYDEILPLIEALDQKPAEETGLVIRVYPVLYADPASLIGTIQNSFPRLRGQKPEDLVKPSYTWGTSSLVVAASPENHERVKDLLEQIDVESSVQRTTHVITLKEGNAEELARQLDQIMKRTQRRRRGDEQGMAIVADPGTNSLLIFGNETELAKVQALVDTLDVPPTFEREIRSFKLTFAEAWATQQAITDLFGRHRGGRRLNPRDEVSVVLDWGSNSVVVAAAPAKMKEIEEFVKQIDQSGAGTRDVRVVTLKHADPDGVVRALNDIFTRQRTGRRGQQTISISNPRGSNSLLIKANDKEFEEISKVIVQLDELPSDEDRAARMFTLKHTDAGEMQAIIEDYLRKPGAGGGRRGRGGQDLVGDVRISTIASNNSLVVTGDQEGLERVAVLVEQIDVEVEDAGTAPKIIKLTKAIASELEPTLTKIFVEGAGRRGGRGQSSTVIQPVIVANDASNSLIVRASPSDYNLIENLAMAMDQEDTDPMARVKLIQVASAFRVNDLAPTIEETLRQAAAPTGQSGRRGGRSRGSEVSVQPIVASNSLLIAGDPKQLEVAEAMVEQIQRMGPAGGRRQIIINTKNMSAEEIKRVIDSMIDQNQSQSTPTRRGRGRRR